MSMTVQKRYFEKAVAAASFVVAAALAFLSLAISSTHEIAAQTGMVIAQFLLLTGSILGIDYKLNNIGHARPE